MALPHDPIPRLMFATILRKTTPNIENFSERDHRANSSIIICTRKFSVFCISSFMANYNKQVDQSTDRSIFILHIILIHVIKEYLYKEDRPPPGLYLEQECVCVDAGFLWCCHYLTQQINGPPFPLIMIDNYDGKGQCFFFSFSF